MTGLAIGLIKACDEISEVVVGFFYYFFFLADKTFRTLLLDTFVLVIPKNVNNRFKKSSILIHIFTKMESFRPCHTPNLSTKFRPNLSTTF